MEIVKRYKENPQWYYAFSVAATWAGVGSMMNSITITTTYGLIPSIIWGIANTFACILFVLVVSILPTLRDIMRTSAMQYLFGALGIFQIWLNMTGIYEIFESTVIGAIGGRIIAYAVAIAFIILLLKFGMIRNVLTDNATWMIVYGTLVIVTIVAFVLSFGNFNDIQLGLDANDLQVGVKKAFLLLSGPFTFPYFFKLMDYNETNEDGTTQVNIKWAFTVGGLMFGIYMIFTYILAFVQFTDTLNLFKAIIIAFVGVSSLSSFLYAEYIVFGKKIGLAINAASVVFWPMLVSLGVMGIWTLISSIRSYIVGTLIVISIVMLLKRKGKGKENERNN